MVKTTPHTGIWKAAHVVRKVLVANKRGTIAAVAVGLAGLGFLQWWSRREERSKALEFSLPVKAPTAAAAAPTEKKARVQIDGVFFKRVWRLIRIIIPSINSKEGLQLGLMTILLLSRTWLSIYLAEVVGYNAKALVDRKFSQFVRGVLHLGAVTVPASVVNAGLKYMSSSMAQSWRSRLTEHVHKMYLTDNTFYKSSQLQERIDNADQRVTEDLELFCSTLSDLYSNTFKPAVDAVLYTTRLAKLLGWEGPTTIWAYYFFVTVVLRFLMPSFSKLTAQQQNLEGNYRFAHLRLIANSEEIAFLQGGVKERSIIARCFDAVYVHSKIIFRKQAIVNVANGLLVKYGATMVGYAICALPVFRSLAGGNKDEIASVAAKLTENYVRDSRLLIGLAVAIGELILMYKRVTSLAGYTSRVSELLEQLHKVRVHSKELANVSALDIVRDTDVIRFEHVDIVTPDNTVLVKDLNMTIEQGSNLMIDGPNGVGKSSIFRVLAGLWPVSSGQIIRPPSSDFFIVPQKSFLALGTLRDNLIYPDTVEQMKEKKVTDDDLKELLRAAKISKLCDREEDGLDAVQDWQEVLSGGEKQRVQMIRLYYHKPRFAILDECTSAVAFKDEDDLYDICKRLNITIITISHRQSLWKHHSRLLEFSDTGSYKLVPITPDMLKQ